MNYAGSLRFVRTGETEYEVTFTPEDQPSAGGETIQRHINNEPAFAEFLLDAGFGAQHSDGIQGALHSVGHHSADVRLSERRYHRLFPGTASTPVR